MTVRRTGLPAAMVAVALLATASCGSSGGGGDSAAAPDDAIDGPRIGRDLAVQITGAGGVRLAGSFVAPAGGTGQPGVLILPAVGGGDRNGPISLTGIADRVGEAVSKSLTEAGVATLRYDRRGTFESKLDPKTPVAFDDLVADAKAGVDFLAERRETAGTKLAIVAYDTGGFVALRLAAADPRVTRVVLISSPGRPLVDLQADQLTAAYGAASADAFRAVVADLLATGELPPGDTLRSELRPLLPPDNVPFLAQIYRIDPVADARAVTVPVLVLAGGKSTSATTVDADRLRAALGAKAEMVVAPNADAGLNNLVVQTPDPASHDFAMGVPSDVGSRDVPTLNRLTEWLRTGLA